MTARSGDALQNEYAKETEAREHHPFQDQQTPALVTRLAGSGVEEKRNGRTEQQQENEPAKEQHGEIRFVLPGPGQLCKTTRGQLFIFKAHHFPSVGAIEQLAQQQVVQRVA